MIERTSYTKLIKDQLAVFPAVTLVGPRQCGKTTLAKSLQGHYFDLEQDSEQVRLDVEWPNLIEQNKLIILDEAQSWPEVFKRIRGAIDEKRQVAGRFLLLGSISPSLMQHASESLAGRLSIIELTPLIWNELATQTQKKRLWFCGGYPEGGVLKPARYFGWQKNYLELLITRDLPVWGFSGHPVTMRRLTHMLAGIHGRAWNASAIGSSLGLSHHTVNNYVDYLEGAFLVRRLPAYFTNIRKRLVKSPKFYWRDSGLLHMLQNVSAEEDLLNQPWVGASWEGFVIDQIISAFNISEKHVVPYHFRSSDRKEIDLVLDFGSYRWAVEVKLTSSPKTSDLQKLRENADLIGANKIFLISNTRATAEGKDEYSCNLNWFIENAERLMD